MALAFATRVMRPRFTCAMTLHFAYGSNMSRALMGARCPGAMALGVATLAGWRFVINPDGVGSIAPPQAGQKRAPSGSSTPHAAQAIARRVPHATQKRAPTGLS